MLTAAEPFNLVVQTRFGPMIVNRYDRYVGQSLILYGEFSEGESALFKQVLKAGDVVVEAGANIGAHTIALSRLVGPQGRVFAFEPMRIVFQTLCGNVALGQCTNVIARQEGLANKPGRMLAPSPDPSKANNFGGLSLMDQGSGEEVTVATLDSLSLKRCALLKADVEGMELAVLDGARETIARCRPVLYLENDRQEKSGALIERVLSLGYRAWWHTPPLFNPGNFNRNPVNQFAGIVSVNMLCQPIESARPVEAMVEIRDAADWWIQAGPR